MDNYPTITWLLVGASLTVGVLVGLVVGCAPTQIPSFFSSSRPMVIIEPGGPCSDCPHPEYPDWVKLAQSEFASDSGTIKTVFFASNRAELSNVSLPPGEVIYGMCVVSIPAGHRIGEFDRPIFGIELLENVDRHITLRSLHRLTKERLLEAVNSQHAALVFIHGFNVSFKEAALRTAQLAHDLSFPGIPTFFSWTSNGLVRSYARDEEQIVISRPAIRQFLKDIADSEVETVILIAHSMGSRAMTRAIGELASQMSGEVRGKFKKLILAAPDISRDVFITEIAGPLGSFDIEITVYASNNDRALKASHLVHDSVRIGEPDGYFSEAPYAMIDASEASASFFALNHSYYADTREILADVHQLINGLPIERRFGLRHVRDRSYYLLPD